MKFIVYWIFGLVLLSMAPALILGAVFTVGIYYFLYSLFKDLFKSNDGYGGGGSYHESDDPGSDWHGTGNPYV